MDVIRDSKHDIQILFQHLPTILIKTQTFDETLYGLQSHLILVY